MPDRSETLLKIRLDRDIGIRETVACLILAIACVAALVAFLRQQDSSSVHPNDYRQLPAMANGHMKTAPHNKPPRLPSR